MLSAPCEAANALRARLRGLLAHSQTARKSSLGLGSSVDGAVVYVSSVLLRFTNGRRRRPVSSTCAKSRFGR